MKDSVPPVKIQATAPRVKIGLTGTFFRPGRPPYELGEFIACRILEIRGEKLFVELEDGTRGEIQALEFLPQYFAQPRNKD